MPKSTPVVAFGDPGRAEVATLGINPSKSEFTERRKLLTGVNRRLATLDSIGAEGLDLLTDVQVAAVIEDCATYFQRRPFRLWFDPLDRLLREVGASYYDGSACHLDLVQWATDPVWGKIPDSRVRWDLLKDGVPHLRAQLERERFRLILLNGRQVLNQVLALGLCDIDEVGSLALGSRTCRLYNGRGGGVFWVGWSTNLQGSWGVSAIFKQQLGAWLAGTTATSPGGLVPQGSLSPIQVDANGYLPRGLRVGSKTELVKMLRRWLVESRAATIGDVGNFGGTPCLLIHLGTHTVALNVDTKRDAVETFVRQNSVEPERPWRVVANRNGRVNKVLPGPGRELVPGWYAYVTHPLHTEGVL